MYSSRVCLFGTYEVLDATPDLKGERSANLEGKNWGPYIKKNPSIYWVDNPPRLVLWTTRCCEQDETWRLVFAVYHTYVYMYVHNTYIYMNVYIYMYTTHTSICMYITHTSICMFTSICILHIHRYVCIHLYICTQHGTRRLLKALAPA